VRSAVTRTSGRSRSIPSARSSRRRLAPVDRPAPERPANVWIGLGAIVVALATGLSRGGDYTFVYLGQLVGVALMFVGFTLPAVPSRPTAAAGAAFRPAAR